MRGQRDFALGIACGSNVNIHIGCRQHTNRFLRPFGQLQPGAGEDIPEASVFPFARIAEAVEVKVPDLEPIERIRLHHRIGRALDASGHAQRLQQMPHKRRLARTQIAMQRNEGMMQRGLRGQAGGEQMGRRFIGPAQAPHGAFYNGEVTINRMQFDGNQLVSQIGDWARELGFSQIGVTGVNLTSAEPGLLSWLEAGCHGEMDYMQRHGLKRARPAELVPGTVRVISARMDYLPKDTPEGWTDTELARLDQPAQGTVSLYARGRDYHKVLRKRLQQLSERIAVHIGPLGYRVFTDSAPVLEVELAQRSALGWRGKHTLLLNRDSGSMFFLGEIFVDVPLPESIPVADHCGTCSACITACPTQAIVAPQQLDARRCISYLTIEYAGPIPLEFREAIGNRIYGCDDCQLVCPWNKFAKRSALPDFDPREGLTGVMLANLLDWSEVDFLRLTEGSPIRRIGHERWLRNVAVACGNALRGNDNTEVRAALQRRLAHDSPLVREHVEWALAQESA